MVSEYFIKAGKRPSGRVCRPLSLRVISAPKRSLVTACDFPTGVCDKDGAILNCLVGKSGHVPIPGGHVPSLKRKDSLKFI